VFAKVHQAGGGAWQRLEPRIAFLKTWPACGLANWVVALIFLCAISGCADSGSFCYGRFAQLHQSMAQSEIFDRVYTGFNVAIPPMGSATGDVWPGASKTVPTLLDLERQWPIAVRTGNPGLALRKHRGGFGLCKVAPGGQHGRAVLAPGVALGLCYTPPPLVSLVP
jgi:hypothetical protein